MGVDVPRNPGSFREFREEMGYEDGDPWAKIAYSRVLEELRVELSRAAGVSLEALHDNFQTANKAGEAEKSRATAINPEL